MADDQAKIDAERQALLQQQEKDKNKNKDKNSNNDNSNNTDIDINTNGSGDENENENENNNNSKHKPVIRKTGSVIDPNEEFKVNDYNIIKSDSEGNILKGASLKEASNFWLSGGWGDSSSDAAKASYKTLCESIESMVAPPKKRRRRNRRSSIVCLIKICSFLFLYVLNWACPFFVYFSFFIFIFFHRK